MRAVAASLAIHAAILAAWALWPRDAPEIALAPPEVRSEPEPLPTTTFVQLVEVPGDGGKAAGGHRMGKKAAKTAVKTVDKGPWDEVEITTDGPGPSPGPGSSSGNGNGNGNGNGHGIGFGDGGGIAEMPAVAAPPVPKPSLARPARLLRPARERDTVEEKLFVARVTVDEDGDVVGAHLVKFAPSRAAELAEAAVWQFHYSPALDDDGRPIRSTFEQPFQLW